MSTTEERPEETPFDVELAALTVASLVAIVACTVTSLVTNAAVTVAFFVAVAACTVASWRGPTVTDMLLTNFPK